MAQNERILTLDVLRGLAIIGMIIIHAIVFAIFEPDPALYDEILERAHPVLLVLLAPLVLVAAWFAIFIFVNGVTVGYSFVREYNRENSNVEKLFFKKCINAFALILLGSVYAPVLSHTSYNHGSEYQYSTITGSLYLGEMVNLDSSRFFSHSIFEVIAYSSIVISTILLILCKVSSKEDDDSNQYITNILIFRLILLGILFLVLSLGLEMMEKQWNIQDNISTNAGWYWTEVWSRIFGQRHSVLPAIVFAFPGAIIGVIMHQPDDQRADQIRKFGFGSSLVLLGSFGIYLIIQPQNLIQMVVLEIQPVMVQIANLGALLVLSTLFILKIDFHADQALMRKRTRVVRRFSMASLSVYMLESLIAVLLRNIFLMIGGDSIFPWNFWIDVLFIAVLLIFWHFMLLLWANYNFTGSFEWAIVNIMRIFGNNSSRLQTKQILM